MTGSNYHIEILLSFRRTKIVCLFVFTRPYILQLFLTRLKRVTYFSESRYNVIFVFKGIFLLWCCPRKTLGKFWNLINSKKRLFSYFDYLGKILSNTRVSIRTGTHSDSWQSGKRIFNSQPSYLNSRPMRNEVIKSANKKPEHAVKVDFLSQHSKTNK